LLPSFFGFQLPKAAGGAKITMAAGIFSCSSCFSNRKGLIMTGGKNRGKTARGKKGFTLVELMIVISILVIMISIMAVAAGPIMHQVYVTSCQSQLKTLAQVYLNYANQSSITFPSLNGTDTSKGTPPSGGGTSGFDNLIYSSATGQNGVNGYTVGFGPLSWHQLAAASYYVCPAISGRDQWWHDPGSGGSGGEDYYLQTGGNCNPDTVLTQNQLGTGTSGAKNVGTVGYNTSGVQQTYTAQGQYIIASYSIRPGLYGWTPSQVMMQHGQANLPAYRAFIADSFYVDANQLSVINRHKDGINVAYLDGTVKYSNYPFLTLGPTNSPPTSTVGSTLDQMWADFDLN
jgi:prepilin-type N-terminal cleavage/methylation domain-containing protein/prepilin-type processing-associated H-X9-DG protein